MELYFKNSLLAWNPQFPSVEKKSKVTEVIAAVIGDFVLTIITKQVGTVVTHLIRIPDVPGSKTGHLDKGSSFSSAPPHECCGNTLKQALVTFSQMLCYSPFVIQP
jgi:hypothetical protein